MQIVKCDMCGRKIDFPLERTRTPEFNGFYYMVDLCGKCFEDYENNFKKQLNEEYTRKIQSINNLFEQRIYKHFNIKEMIEGENDER